MSWETVLQQADDADGIDLTGMATADIEGLFAHLDEAEVERLAADLEEARAMSKNRREFVARTLDALSTVAGISLRLLRA